MAARLIRIAWFAGSDLWSAGEVISRKLEQNSLNYPGTDILEPFLKNMRIAQSQPVGIQVLEFVSDPDASLSQVIEFIRYFHMDCLNGKVMNATIDGRNITEILLEIVEAVAKCVHSLKRTKNWLRDERIASIRRDLERRAKISCN